MNIRIMIVNGQSAKSDAPGAKKPKINWEKGFWNVFVIVCKALAIYCLMVLALLYTFLKACWKST